MSCPFGHPLTCTRIIPQACGRAGLTNRRTRNKMQLTFRDHPGRRVLLNMRNWCEVEEELKVRVGVGLAGPEVAGRRGGG